MEARRPQHVPRVAERCLEAIDARGLGEKLSLGGAYGLLHYHDYRWTHDVDAWWEPEATPAERAQIVEAIRDVLSDEGEVSSRAWGEVVSVELKQEGKKVFSFQIAERSARLERSRTAPGTGVLLDSFRDLVAGKMVALVERGAPRDFRDVYEICRQDLIFPAECWRLWRLRQEAANASADPRRARLAVETHLARIGKHRPLDAIEDEAERRAAQRARAWYKKDLLDALVD